MRWSWKLGHIAGIGIYVHVTFLILLPVLAVVYYRDEQTISGALRGVAFILTLFGIVVLHELGHALAARRYGIQTRDITLLPIGGVARLERIPREPLQEIVVALAGPAVNVLLAAILFVILALYSGAAKLSPVEPWGGGVLANLIWINVALAAFNMLPAFPMDGGRVLRGILATRLDYARATQIAATVGQGMAFLFGMLGLMGNPFLIFIALFVWMGAADEAAMAQMQWALGGIPVSRAMIKDVQTLTPDEPLQSAVDHLLAGFQQDFPVQSDHEVVGILTRRDLLAALNQRGPQAKVSEVMQRQFAVADLYDTLESALARLQESGMQSLPILRDGRLVGILTTDNLGEFLMVQAALKRRAR